MTEIKKITKITLLWYGVAGLLFGIPYVFLADFFAWTLMQWPFNDPVSFWSLGGTLSILAIVSFMAYFKKEWEEIKLFFLLMMMWTTFMILMNIFIIALLGLPETPMMFIILNLVLLTFDLVIGIFSWMKQRS